MSAVPAETFRFGTVDWRPRAGVARLEYRLEPGPVLVETFEFGPAGPAGAEDGPAVRAALDLLHWVAGVSYWKAWCPRQIVFDAAAPDAWQAGFLRRLYTGGLAEFALRNGLDLDGIGFPARGAARVEPALSLGLAPHSLVPLGGGKDSLVALELVRAVGGETAVTAVRPAALIERVAAATGLAWLPVGRRLAPELAELNAAGAYNGHVPITAINAAALLIQALRQGFGRLVFANEASAEEGVVRDGREANHQFSKTLAFERDLDQWIRRYIAADLRCFSALRPLTEIAVCRRFADLKAYHGLFSSCNRQFHLDGARVAGRWCGDCPKCRFVFLGLAPFMERGELLAIFGADLLDDPGQIEGFADLCGLGRKPFECVGEAAECRAACNALAQRQEWRQAAVIAALAPRLTDHATPPLAAFLEPRPEHALPPDLVACVNAPD